MKDEIVLINGEKYLEFKSGSYVRLKDLKQTISKHKTKAKPKKVSKKKQTKVCKKLSKK
jgi:hypothetical protein